MKSQKYVESTKDDVMQHTNERYDQLLETLVSDGIITQDQSDIIEEYRCIVLERNVFGKLWEYFFRDKKEDRWCCVVQKLDKQ